MKFLLIFMLSAVILSQCARAGEPKPKATWQEWHIAQTYPCQDPPTQWKWDQCIEVQPMDDETTLTTRPSIGTITVRLSPDFCGEVTIGDEKGALFHMRHDCNVHR